MLFCFSSLTEIVSFPYLDGFNWYSVANCFNFLFKELISVYSSLKFIILNLVVIKSIVKLSCVILSTIDLTKLALSISFKERVYVVTLWLTPSITTLSSAFLVYAISETSFSILKYFWKYFFCNFDSSKTSLTSKSTIELAKFDVKSNLVPLIKSLANTPALLKSISDKNCPIFSFLTLI